MSTLHIKWDEGIGWIVASAVVGVAAAWTSLECIRQYSSLDPSNRSRVFYVLWFVCLYLFTWQCTQAFSWAAILITDQTSYTVGLTIHPGIILSSLLLPFLLLPLYYWLSTRKTLTYPRIKWALCGVAHAAIIVSANYISTQAFMVDYVKIPYSSTYLPISLVISFFLLFPLPLFVHHYTSVWSASLPRRIGAACAVAISIVIPSYLTIISLQPEVDLSYTPLMSPSTLPASSTVGAIFAALAGTWLLGFFIARFYSLKQHFSSDSTFLLKHSSHSLILTMVIWDENQRILVNSSGALPSVLIEANYQGKSVFNQTNTDFLRMFKTSFNWTSMETYMEHLKHLKKEHKLNTYSIEIYKKFMNSIQELSILTNIPIHQFGNIFWSPFQHRMVTIITRSTAAKMQEYIQHAKTSLHFSYPQTIQNSMNKFLRVHIEEEEEDNAKNTLAKKNSQLNLKGKNVKAAAKKKYDIKKDTSPFKPVHSFYSTSSQSMGSSGPIVNRTASLIQQQGITCLTWLKELEYFLDKYSIAIHTPHQKYLEHYKKKRRKKNDDDTIDDDDELEADGDEEDIIAVPETNTTSNLPASTVQNSSSSSLHRDPQPYQPPSTILSSLNPLLQPQPSPPAQPSGVYSASFNSMQFPPNNQQHIIALGSKSHSNPNANVPSPTIHVFLSELARRDLKIPDREIETTVLDWIRIINNAIMVSITNSLLKQNENPPDSASTTDSKRKTPPKSIKTKAQLQQLIQNQSHIWSSCTLPIHVKTAIQNHFYYANLSSTPFRHNAMSTPPALLNTPQSPLTSQPGDEHTITDQPLPPPHQQQRLINMSPSIQPNHLNSINNLYVGLYYSQTSADKSLHVLIPQSGPFNMIPIVPVKGRFQLSLLSTMLDTVRRLNQKRKEESEDGKPYELDFIEDVAKIRALMKILIKSANPTANNNNHEQTQDNEPSAMEITQNTQTGKPQPHVDQSDNMDALLSAVFTSCHILSEIVGHTSDINVGSLYLDDIIPISPHVNLMPFVVCKMATTFPKHYLKTCQFIPLPLFEVLHSNACPNRHQESWTRSLLSKQLRNEKHHKAMAHLADLHMAKRGLRDRMGSFDGSVNYSGTMTAGTVGTAQHIRLPRLLSSSMPDGMSPDAQLLTLKANKGEAALLDRAHTPTGELNIYSPSNHAFKNGVVTPAHGTRPAPPHSNSMNHTFDFGRVSPTPSSHHPAQTPSRKLQIDDSSDISSSPPPPIRASSLPSASNPQSSSQSNTPVQPPNNSTLNLPPHHAHHHSIRSSDLETLNENEHPLPSVIHVYKNPLSPPRLLKKMDHVIKPVTLDLNASSDATATITRKRLSNVPMTLASPSHSPLTPGAHPPNSPDSFKFPVLEPIRPNKTLLTKRYSSLGDYSDNETDNEQLDAPAHSLRTQYLMPRKVSGEFHYGARSAKPVDKLPNRIPNLTIHLSNSEKLDIETTSVQNKSPSPI